MRSCPELYLIMVGWFMAFAVVEAGMFDRVGIGILWLLAAWGELELYARYCNRGGTNGPQN